MSSLFLKSTFFLLIFYGIYKLLLEKTNMHFYKRFYLLAAVVFSFIFPFIVFTIHTIEPVVFRSGLPLQPDEDLPALFVLKEKTEGVYKVAGCLLYVVITLVLFFRFVRNIHYFFREKKKGIEIKKGTFNLVLLDYRVAPHSFLSWVFISASDYNTDMLPQEVLWHEEAHVRQKHTLDIFLIELLLVFFWFQPMLYFFRKAIKSNHEFMADEVVVKQTHNIVDYQNYLVDAIYPARKLALSSAFLFNLTKKRLLMMTTKTNILHRRILSVIPFMVLGLLLITFSCTLVDDTKMPIQTETETAEKEVYTFVDVKAAPAGGIQHFYRTFMEKFSRSAVLKKEPLVKVTIKFIVEQDGSMTNFTIQKGNKEAGEVCVRILKEMPEWKPAVKDGKAVRSSFVLPITIKTHNE